MDVLEKVDRMAPVSSFTDNVNGSGFKDYFISLSHPIINLSWPQTKTNSHIFFGIKESYPVIYSDLFKVRFVKWQRYGTQYYNYLNFFFIFVGKLLF